LCNDEYVAPVNCVFCGAPIEGGDAAVGVGASSEDPIYIPFLEDCCDEYMWLMHAACFGREQSMDSLVDVIHEHDIRQRELMKALRGG
jgi:hypothetical protein